MTKFYVGKSILAASVVAGCATLIEVEAVKPGSLKKNLRGAVVAGLLGSTRGFMPPHATTASAAGRVASYEHVGVDSAFQGTPSQKGPFVALSEMFLDSPNTVNVADWYDQMADPLGAASQYEPMLYDSSYMPTRSLVRSPSYYDSDSARSSSSSALWARPAGQPDEVDHVADIVGGVVDELMDDLGLTDKEVVEMYFLAEKLYGSPDFDFGRFDLGAADQSANPSSTALYAMPAGATEVENALRTALLEVVKDEWALEGFTPSDLIEIPAEIVEPLPALPPVRDYIKNPRTDEEITAYLLAEVKQIRADMKKKGTFGYSGVRSNTHKDRLAPAASHAIDNEVTEILPEVEEEVIEVEVVPSSKPLDMSPDSAWWKRNAADAAKIHKTYKEKVNRDGKVSKRSHTNAHLSAE